MPRKLLVVDDISTNREILKKILGGEYEITEAANGVEALSVLKRRHNEISAVILDLAMPIMNGFEVISNMRANPELSHIPVIVATGQTEEESEVKALSLGANDYIAKPYNSTIIKQRIRNTINLRETAATVNALQRDKLTGLYNREIFFEKAGELIEDREAGYYTMASFDIDSFKVINDQYGTKMGDSVLRYIASCIKRFTKGCGGICSRITADNFALLYPSSVADSEAIKKTHAEVTRPPELNRDLSIRIGRYTVANKALPVSAMYDRAKLAEGSVGDRFDVYIGVYDESMRTHILREQEIVNEMNAALRGKQFEVWFQPQFNHSTGALIGAEGLVRWRHPSKGLVSPGEFIPIFERNGFVYELDKYVWEQTCHYLRKWLDEGREPLPLSVNVSRYDLFREDLLDTIAAIVDKYEIPCDLLRFEVTESAFAESPETIISVVEKLTEKGFSVEIDDFGSGYSSLNTLKNVPADILKLDMRFLEGGGNSSRGGNIIESVVRMAKWLGMPVIAEGVETLEQADYLKSIGCYYIQGYLYAKPMPADEYESYSMRFSSEREMLKLETVENLDNNTFWDPNSMDTLIFNSYVGGACIFEFYNDSMEILRINENFAKELAQGRLTVEDAHAIVIEDYLDAENRSKLTTNVLNAINTREESSCELELIDFNGPGRNVYLRVTVRVIATAGKRYLIYCSIFNMTELRMTEKKELDVSRQMLMMMNDTPGGFCRMRVAANKPPVMVYANEGFCRLSGMSHDEVMRIYSVDAWKCIHPDDRGDVEVATHNKVFGGAQFNVKARLRKGVSEYTRVVLSGRFVELGSGEMYLNAYFSDITEQTREEEEQKAIIDRMPCGIAVYRYAAGYLCIEYMNSLCRKLIGHPDGDLSHVDVMDAIHPDDRNAVKAEIEVAIETQRAIELNLRLRSADNRMEYDNFKAKANIAASGDGSILIYAMFLRISEGELIL